MATNSSPQHSKWSAYINRKFDEYRAGKRGSAASLTSFANQFGANHSVVIGWLRPGSTPPRKYQEKIIEIFGEEAYEPLGLPTPVMVANNDGTAQRLSEKEKKALQLFDEAPEEFQDEILDLVEHYLVKHGFRRTR